MKKTTSIIIAMALTSLSVLNGQELLRYTFTSGSVDPLGLPTTGLSASTISANGNSGFSASANNAFINGQGNTGELGNQYFEFTLTPDEGSFLNISKVFFDYGGESTDYSISLAIRSSLDGFTINLAEIIDFESPGTGTNATPERLVANLISDPEYQNIVSSVTFRIYGWGDSRFGASPNPHTRRMRIDDVKVEGTISPIPEPAHYTLLAGLFTFIAVRLFSRRK